MITYRHHALSRSGGRRTNQDSWAHVPGDTLSGWLLADGLGGHGGGEVASRLGIETAARIIGEWRTTPVEAPPHAIVAANDAILEMQSSGAALAEMRTTMVVLVAASDVACWSWIGDSRLYYFRAGRIEHRTKDHSLPQKLVDLGQLAADDIRGHPDRNRLLRALGADGSLTATKNLKFSNPAPGDAFLLCTDGFWELVLDAEMEIDLAKADGPETWLAHMEDRLLRRVDEQGLTDHDNYTAIAVLAS